MAAIASAMSTPINTVSRDNLKVLLRNNLLNDTVEFVPDCDTSMMEIDSPKRKPGLQPISKKLFHSPMSENESPNHKNHLSPTNPRADLRTERDRRRAHKRKQKMVPDSCEKIKRAFVKECEGDGYSPEVCGGMRKRVLISLFHSKEYSMDFS